MCSFGSDGAATSFCVLARPLRQSSVYLSLSRGVVLGHSSTLCDQPRKAFTGHPSYILRRHIYIVGERGRLFSSPMPAQRIEDVFRNATILHMAEMTQPSQSALSKQSVHTGKTCTRHGISRGYFVLPGYTQDIRRMFFRWKECVEPSLLSGISSPCIAAIQR